MHIDSSKNVSIGFAKVMFGPPGATVDKNFGLSVSLCMKVAGCSLLHNAKF